MHNSQFSVAGMSSSTSSHHNPNLNTWGTTSTSTSFGESLSQSRSHYQSGYLMSATQSTNSPQGNQRVDEAPVVQTKAKLNQVLTRGSASDFGMESMFQSTRQRQNLADEDAPPVTSVNDIPNEAMLESNSTRFKSRQSTLESSQYGKRHAKAPSVAATTQLPLYIIVFGYPPDKYSVTAEYFKSLGDSTDADPNTEVQNCFRIGYKDPAEAVRAVRKNGEILGGSWMIGVKWADQAQADALLAQPSARGNTFGDREAMSVDDPIQPSASNAFLPNTPTFGTPIKLEPSTSAFRRPAVQGSKPGTPQAPNPWAPAVANGGGSGDTSSPAVQPSPSNKTVLGQVSDLIFGW